MNKSRKKYYSNCIDNCDGDQKKIWRVLNNIIGEQKRSHVIELNINGIISNDAKIISNELNDYFVEIGVQISNSFTNLSHVFNSNLIPESIFEFNQVTEIDITDAIMNLKKKLSCGWDDVVSVIFVNSKEQIVPI